MPLELTGMVQHVALEHESMPLFYLTLNECGAVYEDEAGLEYPHLDAAKHQAMLAARELMSIELLKGKLCLACRIEIADQDRTLLTTVAFRDVVAISGF